jgi:pimeloyl-ACP methyl ester carboxylesterase
MAFATVNDTKLYYKLEGEAGQPLVLIHGSWGDHRNWDGVAPGLSEHFRVLRYDRRGHSQSEAPPGQGSVLDDASDAAALVEHLDLSPVHVVGNSFGASIALRLACRRPDLFRSLIVHEPPLLDLLSGDPKAEPYREAVIPRIDAVVNLLQKGEMEAAARQFVETIALGPGGWQELSSEQKETFVANGLTWLDEVHDPDALSIDLDAFASFPHAALVSHGDQSPPFFPMIVDKVARALPNARQRTFAGAGHVPHVSHPVEFIDLVRTFAR